MHTMLQGKGGAGKSTVCYLLLQYFLEKQVPAFGMDTDPLNPTFSGFKALQVESIPIMKGEEIDSGQFDLVMNKAFSLPHGTQLVVDNGASTFAPFCSYAKECGAFQLLESDGHEVIVHSVITGGGALRETIKGLARVAYNFPDARIVVWINPKDGPVEIDGKDFYSFKIFKDFGHQFHSVVELPTPSALSLRDVTEHLAKGHTFEEARHSSLSVMNKRRLEMYWGQVVSSIDKANLV